jgi:hypothetical protein
VHFPLWAIVAIVAATVILSIATTLITLTLEHMRRAATHQWPRPNPRPARQASLLRHKPKLDRARSSPAITTRPGTTCTGPTAIDGLTRAAAAVGKRDRDGCRTASPRLRSEPLSVHFDTVTVWL